MKRISGIYCDCCGAAWVAGVGFPCACLVNEYCSTCLYCVDHCQCGEDQDLRADPFEAATVRIARRLAGEKLLAEHESLGLADRQDLARFGDGSCGTLLGRRRERLTLPSGNAFSYKRGGASRRYRSGQENRVTKRELKHGH
jgi:hypothetical protein